MKKALTLDLNAAVSRTSASKSQHETTTSTSLPGLSLDINLMKMDTPDLIKVDTPTIEHLILSNNIANTPSPSILFPRTVTAEQETFAGGFVEALNNLHNSNSQQSTASEDNGSNYDEGGGGGTNATLMPQFLNTVIKEEPQIVPTGHPTGGVAPTITITTSPVSPVDMEYQERMKLERKRQRNRLAASKCRSRKLERISKLEDKVKLLKTENTELSSVVNQLKEHVGLLKLEVMQHVNAGCPIINGQY